MVRCELYTWLEYYCLLKISEKKFMAQSILKTFFDENVEQAPSSKDQFTATSEPHQNVSRKKVVTMPLPTKAVTTYSAFRSHGIVAGMSRKYSARMASFGQ